MTEWVRHADFRKALPVLLEGEDEEFSRYIQNLAHAADAEIGPRPAPSRKSWTRRDLARPGAPR